MQNNIPLPVLQARLDVEIKELRAMQSDLSNNQTTRAQFMAQLKENELVKQELELVEPGTNIYKMIGPALIKQDQNEAVSNVEKRIDFIQNEIKKLNTLAEGIQNKQKDKRQLVLALQAKIQAESAAQQGGRT